MREEGKGKKEEDGEFFSNDDCYKSRDGYV